MHFKRDRCLQKLIAKMHNGLIKIITGMRGSGKSYLLKEFRAYLQGSGVPDSRIIAMEFDRPENRRYRDPEVFMAFLHERIRDHENYYVLLDEVQFLGSFEEALSSLLYEDNIDTYVTGSDSRFLSTDVRTEFRGRGEEIRVFPLSFAEFMSACDGETRQGWQEYLRYGGLPFAAALQTDEEKSGYLRGLFQETCLKDITERRRLRKDQELEDLPQVLASSIGSLTNPSKITSALESKCGSRIALNTVKSYIDCLKEAFLISEARRCDVNVKGRKAIGSAVK